jgi:hypothetical protein
MNKKAAALVLAGFLMIASLFVLIKYRNLAPTDQKNPTVVVEEPKGNQVPAPVYPEEDPNAEFKLKPTAADAAGVAAASHFILKTVVPVSEEILVKALKMIPEVTLSVKKVNAQENTYEIIPAKELEPNKVYTIQLAAGDLAAHDFSWAYQVKAPFQLVSAIPGDKGTSVPTNTGIELYFNRDNIINPESFIELIPAATGRYQVDKNKVIFIPDSPLAERTIYTLKIKAGLRADGTADVLASDKIIQFETSQASYGQEPYAYFSRRFAEFKPGSDVVLGVNAYNVSSVSGVVYRFDSDKEFMDSVAKAKDNSPWAYYFNDLRAVDLPENKKVLSSNFLIETADYYSYVRLPQTLPAGYYAAIITTEKNNKDITWFQVNPAASFVALATSKSLIWLKDAGTEKNLSGVPIFFNNKKIGQTGADGVALFNTPADLQAQPEPYFVNDRKFFVAKTPSGSLVVPIENEYGSGVGLNPNDTAWDYVSLNKNIYLPTDNLHFWTVYKPRNGSVVSGEDIDVTLTNPYWYENQENIATYAQTKVKLSSYNTITGELSFVNLKPGIYDLAFRKGTEVIARQTVTVNAYIKPAYKITLTPDKNSLFAGDTATFKVKALFFDGTPVQNTSLSYSAYGLSAGNYQGTIMLDENGEGSFTITPEYKPDGYQWANYLTVSVTPTKAEEGQIVTSYSLFVFGAHINNTITQTQTPGTVSFTVKTRAVVLSSAVRGEPYWNMEEYLGGPIAEAKTTVDIVEVVYSQEQTGTGYDPINKLTYPIYSYTTSEQNPSAKIITAGQNGVAQFSFALDKTKTYKFKFTTKDSVGREVSSMTYVSGGAKTEIDSTQAEPAYYLTNLSNPNGENYKVGTPINLRLQTEQGLLPPDGKGKFIFMTVNNGDLEYKIQNTPTYNAAFRNKDIPNIGIWSGWFSGGRFRNGFLQNISFDANEKRLQITVTKDKAAYKPGETVRLAVKVTDNNNHPVSAEVNLSALDEAVFSMSPDEKDMANDLYRDIFSSVVIRTSNMPPYGGGGAERGGGGDGAPRSDFQEMALFKSVITDASGNASVEFKLPDNITSWRVTTQAISKNIMAGKDISFIPVTLPFFVDATLNNTYLAGDNLSVRLRTFGTSVSPDAVRYSAESPTLPFKKVEEVGISSGVDLPLGPLSVGTHKLTVRAQRNTFSDALTRPLQVVSSYFTQHTATFYEGTKGLKMQINPLGYTTLTLSSYGRGELYNNLYTFLYQPNLRLDQKGSVLVATNLLNQYFGQHIEQPVFNGSAYQNENGGLQLLPYSDDDLELSAIAAHLFEAGTFDAVSLKNYFTVSLSDQKASASRITRALYGLAAFGEPVLIKVEAVKNDLTLTLQDKIFVALTLDKIGAKEAARLYYRQRIKPMVEINNGYAYVKMPGKDETITNTALVAALTASLQEPEAKLLAMYIKNNFPDATLSNFELLLYIKSTLPTLDPEEVTFTYMVGSKKVTKTLKDGEFVELNLSPQELSSFELLEITGKLGISAQYEEASSPELIKKDSNLLITRKYFVDGKETKEFHEGDWVTIELELKFGSNALDGAYQIVDYVPSGLRPIDLELARSYGYIGQSYDNGMREINDQKVTFIRYKYPNSDRIINYYARVVTKGTYKAEPAIVQSLQNLASMTISNEDSVTIK